MPARAVEVIQPKACLHYELLFTSLIRLNGRFASEKGQEKTEAAQAGQNEKHSTKRLFVRAQDSDQLGRREIQLFQSRYRAQSLVFLQQKAKRRRHVAEGSDRAAKLIAKRGGGDGEPHCRAEQPKRNQNAYRVAMGVGLRAGLHHDRQGREQRPKPDRHHSLEADCLRQGRVRSPQRAETETETREEPRQPDCPDVAALPFDTHGRDAREGHQDDVEWKQRHGRPKGSLQADGLEEQRKVEDEGVEDHPVHEAEGQRAGGGAGAEDAVGENGLGGPRLIPSKGAKNRDADEKHSGGTPWRVRCLDNP